MSSTQEFVAENHSKAVLIALALTCRRTRSGIEEALIRAVAQVHVLYNRYIVSDLCDWNRLNNYTYFIFVIINLASGIATLFPVKSRTVELAVTYSVYKSVFIH